LHTLKIQKCGLEGQPAATESWAVHNELLPIKGLRN
jgi:hypothetical protein